MILKTGDGEKPEGYAWARGVVHRLATEEYHQPRQRHIIDYWHRPKGEEVVEDMVEHGWSREEAEEAVKALWLDQMRSLEEVKP